MFSAAAKSIVVKCLSDDEDESAEASASILFASHRSHSHICTQSSNEVALKRTSTGILSTRRPVEGTPATSGTVTPDESAPRLSLMAHAKRDAARRGLYSRFFKGPVLGPETIAAEEKRLAALVAEAFDKQNPKPQSVIVTEHIEIKAGHDTVSVDLEVSKSCKKRHAKVEEPLKSDMEDDEARRERKRRRKERKAEGTAEDEKKKKSSKHKSQNVVDDLQAGTSMNANIGIEQVGGVKESKAERKQRREQKKRLKALRISRESGADIEESSSQPAIVPQRPESVKVKKERKERTSKSNSIPDALDDSKNIEEKKRKKKRKRTVNDEE